jgi:HEAT repeat protein
MNLREGIGFAAAVLIIGAVAIAVTGAIQNGTAMKDDPASRAASMSKEFDSFLKSNFFGDQFNSIHDGLDTPLLTALQGDDRVRAEDILLKALPDPRAIIGLGEIRSQRAVARLRGLIITRDGTDAAVALVKITGELTGLGHVIDELEDRESHWSPRMDAAISLRYFRMKKAVDALLRALDDPERLVRHHAAISLLVMHGRADRYVANPVELPDLSIRIMREPERAAAAEELRRITKEEKLKAL